MRTLRNFSFVVEAVMVAALVLAFSASSVAATEKILHYFNPLPQGRNPSSPLIEDAAGNLYGVAPYGGVHGAGVVYELSRAAGGRWIEQVLYQFSGSPDGLYPLGRLVFDAAGNLYGITLQGGNFSCAGNLGCGTVYELTRAASGSWKRKVIHTFGVSGVDGQNPLAGLAFDKTGNLYGTTVTGGSNGGGVVFELTPSAGGAWTENVLFSFTPNGAGGSGPSSEVLLDSSGNIYSVTTTGGDSTCGTVQGGSGCGTVFKLTSNSGVWSETVLYAFTGTTNLIPPTGRLLMDSSGNLYGPATQVVYELKPTAQGAWSYTVLQTLPASFFGDLAFDNSGDLIGEGPWGNSGCFQRSCGSVFQLTPGTQGWTFANLYSFKPVGDGWDPCCGVTIGASGEIFGVTSETDDNHDRGTAFELKRSSGGVWQETIIRKFPQVDGAWPWSTLVADSAGNLYGTAIQGGKNTQCDTVTFCGVIYRLSAAKNGQRNYDIIVDMSQDPNAGDTPSGGLVFDASGNIYGTAQDSGNRGGGNVFKLTPTTTGWQRTTLHEFGSFYNDGAEPRAAMIFDAAGNLYGTTESGGAGGAGTVFELSPQPDGTWKETQLYAFTGGNDGNRPFGALVFDQAGNLFGTTFSGGASFLYGAVFELSPKGNGTWVEDTIYSFTGGADGALPAAGLVFDASGNLYGTTTMGGANGGGVVFELKPSGSGLWTESVLHSFLGGPTDGANPWSEVKFDSAGNLYGTTAGGGPTNYRSIFGFGAGTVYRMTPSTGGSWDETILHFFGKRIEDGVAPQAGLYMDSTGNLFGSTTALLGFGNGGTVFEIIP